MKNKVFAVVLCVVLLFFMYLVGSSVIELLESTNKQHYEPKVQASSRLDTKSQENQNRKELLENNKTFIGKSNGLLYYIIEGSCDIDSDGLYSFLLMSKSYESEVITLSTIIVDPKRHKFGIKDGMMLDKSYNIINTSGAQSISSYDDNTIIGICVRVVNNRMNVSN